MITPQSPVHFEIGDPCIDGPASVPDHSIYLGSGLPDSIMNRDRRRYILNFADCVGWARLVTSSVNTALSLGVNLNIKPRLTVYIGAMNWMTLLAAWILDQPTMARLEPAQYLISNLEEGHFEGDIKTITGGLDRFGRTPMKDVTLNHVNDAFGLIEAFINNNPHLGQIASGHVRPARTSSLMAIPTPIRKPTHFPVQAGLTRVA